MCDIILGENIIVERRHVQREIKDYLRIWAWIRVL